MLDKKPTKLLKQLISELEPEKRGPYSGGVGYFSYNGNMDTCIAIRTLILKDKTVYLQAGGGIVADSIIENEYQETLHKMQALIGAIDVFYKTMPLTSAFLTCGIKARFFP